MARFRFSLRRLLSLIVVLAVVLTIGSLYWPTRQNQLRWLYGGRSGLNTVAHAEKAFVSRVRPPRDVFYEDAQASDYRVDTGPLALPSSNVKKLTAALLTADSYEWEWAKACGFRSEYKVTFVRGSQQVDVLFDTGCDVLWVYRNNEFAGLEDFDKVRGAIVPLLDEAFAVEGGDSSQRGAGRSH